MGKKAVDLEEDWCRVSTKEDSSPIV